MSFALPGLLKFKTWSCLLAASILLLLPGLAGTAEARKKRHSLGKIIQRTLSPRTTMFSLARHLGCRQRKASQVTFSRERLDELHPGLSLPGDLPKTDWPHRAVIASEGKLWKVPFRMRIATEMAALSDADRRRHLLTSRQTTLVVVLTAKGSARDTRITPRRVERVLGRMGVRVSITGTLGKCDPATQWCYLQTYYVRPRRGRRGGSIHLELSAPAGDRKSRVRGIKIVRFAGSRKK